VIVENRADHIPAVSGFVSARDNHTLLCLFAGIITIGPPHSFLLRARGARPRRGRRAAEQRDELASFQ
jgi:hypothetical protein